MFDKRLNNVNTNYPQNTKQAQPYHMQSPTQTKNSNFHI